MCLGNCRLAISGRIPNFEEIPWGSNSFLSLGAGGSEAATVAAYLFTRKGSDVRARHKRWMFTFIVIFDVAQELGG